MPNSSGKKSEKPIKNGNASSAGNGQFDSSSDNTKSQGNHSNKKMSANKSRSFGNGKAHEKQLPSNSLSSSPSAFCEVNVLTDGPLSLPTLSLTDTHSPRTNANCSTPSRVPVYTANGVMPYHQSNGRRDHNQDHGQNPYRFHGSCASSPSSGHSIPYSVQLQNAAHNCASQLPTTAYHPHQFANRSPTTSHSASFHSSPNTPGSRRPSGSNNFSVKPNKRQASLPSPNSPFGSMKNNRPQIKYEEYLPLSEVQKSLKKGEVVEGLLRINPRNFEDAYISAPGEEMDICITSVSDRNRALNGDLVAVMIKPMEDWRILYDTIKKNWHEWREQCTNLRSHEYDTIEEGNSNGGADEAFGPTKKSNEEVFDEVDEDEAVNESVTGGQLKNVKPKYKRRQRSKGKNNDGRTDGDEMSVSALEEKETRNQSSKALAKPKNAIYIPYATEKTNKRLPDEISHFEVDDLLVQSFGSQCVQKSGHVVHIMKNNNSRHVGGRIRLMPDRNPNWAMFSPLDSRSPRLMVPMVDCPPDFMVKPKHYENALFMAQIDEEWQQGWTFARGRLIQRLGNAGDIDAETQLILLENQVTDTDFTQDDYVGIPGLEEDKWQLPAEEVTKRRDFRKECVFTVDPATARDLDDALSVKDLNETIDGKKIYEVGVHIADVSYFLREDMPLDQTARDRSTSVYLVQKVIPMLPRILCEKHCSLTPGEDKLTFSVVWKMDEDGKTYDEWFGRTVINSCVKLSYDYAQDMITEPERNWESEELPQLFNSWKSDQISWSVNKMMTIAKSLRKGRYERGALKIDKLKLSFVLNPETGLPSGFNAHLHKESNYLVEELMLMANMAVAEKIYKSFSELSFLRNHPAPDEKLLKEFQKFCEYNNFAIDTTSSATLQQSLSVITEGNSDVSRVVSHFLLRSMKNALYFCTGMTKSMADFHHYALNVPLYTHFTSPIRRYPDVIVHRLLAAALGYCNVIGDMATDLHRLAGKCNQKKQSARLVSEASMKLFLSLYIKEVAPVEEVIVLGVMDRCFDALVLGYGQSCRVYLEKQPDEFTFSDKTVRGVPMLSLTWKKPDSDKVKCDQEFKQEIKSCCKLMVQLQVNDKDILKWNGRLLHPKWTQ